LPLVTAWSAAALAVVGLAWADTSIAPLLVDLDTVRWVVVLIALASIVLSSVAAWIQDDIEHVVGYSIIGDAGVVILAIAALDPAVWAPARTWILAFVVTRSAFAAWAGATRASYQTGRLRDLRGWALRSPGLAIAFVIIVIAGVGLPGLAAWQARGAIIEAAVAGPLALIAWVGVLSPLVYYARLGVIGVDRARPDGQTVDWRPHVRPVDLSRIRPWLAMTWSDNRVPAATATTLGVAVLALAVAAGAFGVPEAAAGAPPSLEGAGQETPDEQIGLPVGPDASDLPSEASEPPIEGSDAPVDGSAEPGDASDGPASSGDAEASGEPTASFEPVPTP
jgi:formate hydrogenlyase subunit 3/multisubunit Na+/H+ antiporter MnhD subunit